MKKPNTKANPAQPWCPSITSLMGAEANQPTHQSQNVQNAGGKSFTFTEIPFTDSPNTIIRNKPTATHHEHETLTLSSLNSMTHNPIPTALSPGQDGSYSPSIPREAQTCESAAMLSPSTQHTNVQGPVADRRSARTKQIKTFRTEQC